MVRSDLSRGSVDSAETAGEWTSVSLLEEIRARGRVWGDLAAQYGVTHPDPPWRTSLEGMCEALAAGSCSSSAAVEKRWLDGSTQRSALDGAPPLPQLERRWEEDELSETLYKDVPFPERQLLALAHSLIKRGLVDEDALARKLAEVKERLTAV
jgi:hypothetical protein